jgi:hypothetical protein
MYIFATTLEQNVNHFIQYKGVQTDFAFRGELHQKRPRGHVSFKLKRETRRSRRLCPENLGRKSVCMYLMDMSTFDEAKRSIFNIVLL